MKNVKMKFTIVALLMCCCLVPLSAQSHIDKVADELEKNNKVEKSLVSRRDPKSGKLLTKVSSYSFTNADLCKKLLAAFEADETSAYHSVVSKEEGEISYALTFYRDDMELLYCLSVEGAEGEFSIIWKPKSKGVSLNNLGNIIGSDLAQWQVFGISEKDKEQFMKDMQHLGEELKEMLPDWN